MKVIIKETKEVKELNIYTPQGFVSAKNFIGTEDKWSDIENHGNAKYVATAENYDKWSDICEDLSHVGRVIRDNPEKQNEIMSASRGANVYEWVNNLVIAANNAAIFGGKIGSI